MTTLRGLTAAPGERLRSVTSIADSIVIRSGAVTLGAVALSGRRSFEPSAAAAFEFGDFVGLDSVRQDATHQVGHRATLGGGNDVDAVAKRGGDAERDQDLVARL
jgi:hypothetical protein